MDTALRETDLAFRAAIAALAAILAVVVSLLLLRLPTNGQWVTALAGILMVLGVPVSQMLLRGVPAGSRAGLLLLLLVMAALPVVKWRGPGNSSAADLPAMLLVGYAAVVALVRGRLVLPDKALLLTVCAIIIGGVGALFASPSIGRSVLTLAQDLFLLLLWVAVLNLRDLTERRCGADWTIAWLTRAWVAVSAIHSLTVLAGRLAPTYPFAQILGYGGGARGVGLFRDPNMAAHYLGASLFAVPVVLAGARNRSERLVHLTAGLALLAGLLATASNGAKVALASAMATVAAASAFLRTGSSRPRVMLLLVLGAILIPALWLLAGSTDLRLSSASDPFRLSEFVPSLEVRISGWQRALDAFLRAPHGVGPGVLGAVSGDDLIGRSEAHNDLLSVLAERGIVGGLGYACFVVAVFAHLWTRPGRQRDHAPTAVIGLSILGMFAFMFTMGLSVDSLHFRHFWFLAGLYLTQGRAAHRGQMVAHGRSQCAVHARPEEAA